MNIETGIKSVNYINQIERIYLYENQIKNKKYNFLLKNNDIFLKILNQVKEIEIIEYKKFKDVLEFKNMLSNTFKNDEIFHIYLSLFILESFNDGLIENNIVNKSYKKDSHESLNRIIKNISNLNIFIRKKEKLIEKEIDKIYDFILKIMKILENTNIIKNHKLYNKENLTYIMWEIKDFKNSAQIDVYQNEFELFSFNGKDYIMSQEFNSIRSINSINLKTKDFILSKQQALFSNLCGKKIYIDLDLLSKILTEYCIENKINSGKIEEEYTILLDNHKNLLKEIDKEALEQSSKKISIYQKAILFNYLIENKIDYCYNPIILDFRGRVYKTSAFSITFIKELRLCIHFGNYDDDFKEKYKEGRTDIILNNYLYLLDVIEKAKEKNKIIKRALLWTFISIAENFKNEMDKEINLKDLIEKGIEVYIKNNLDLINYEKKIKIMSSFKIINMLLESEKILKRPISKDATASVYQHLVKLLEADDKYYKYCNLLSENTYYDTYRFIIDDWKKKNEDLIKIINLENIEKYFNRKTLKKTMMTQNYGCGIETSRKYFFNEIKDEIKTINIKDIKKIGKLFFNFFNFTLHKLPIVKNEINKIREYFISNEFEDIILNDNSKASIRYYILKNRRIDTKVLNRRYTHVLKEKKEELDYEKTNIAVLANYIHILDSAISRDVATRISCFIIHDCFMVGCLEVSELIDIINLCFNSNYDKKWPIKNKKKFYSIFIVI